MYRDRDSRKRQIITQVYLAWLQGRKLTTHQIADRVGLLPSSHLRQMLYEMTTAGLLTMQIISHRPHINKSVYSIDMRRLKKADEQTAQYLDDHYGRQLELML